MSERPRVVVVGAGAAGLSAAMHCSELGADSVTVIEKTQLAQASSGLSAGIFNRQTFDRVDGHMRRTSVEVFDDLEARGLLHLSRCGYVRLARTEQQWKSVLDAVEAAQSPYTELLTPTALQRLVPGMRVDDVVGGMFGPHDGHLDGPELCQAYLRAGRARGVVYRSGTAAMSHTRRGSVHRLETTGGVIEADVVVNAAGGWLAEVSDLLGAPVPINNQRHQIALVRVDSLQGVPVPTVQTYFPGSGADAVYVRPEGTGTFLAGLHSYESQGVSQDPDGYRRGTDAVYLELLAEQLLDRFPGWDDAGLESGWSGIYPLSPDGRFIIGPDSADTTVVTVGGLGGVGLTVSPAAGRLAAEWAVLGQPDTLSDEDAAGYLPNRFASVGGPA